MTKFITLTVDQLRKVLLAYDLETSGRKAELVQRLSDALESDEIESSILADILQPQDKQLQSQIDELKALITDLSTQIINNQSQNKMPDQGGPTNDLTNDDDDGVSQGSVASEQTIQTVVPNEEDGEAYVRKKYSVKEIAETIPEYDPTNDDSVAAEQFVEHVESAAAAYNFDAKCLLLAVYSRMKGVARMWLDGQTKLFTSWENFKNALLDEFGYELNEDEINYKMSSSFKCELC